MQSASKRKHNNNKQQQQQQEQQQQVLHNNSNITSSKMLCAAQEDIVARQCGSSNVFANSNSSCNYQQHNNNSAASMHRPQPHHNRFCCSRSHALQLPLPSTWSLPSQLPVLLLLLVTVAVSMLPTTACTELAMESPVPTIASTNISTANFSTVNKPVSAKSGQDEDNEIFTLVDHDADKAVNTSPEFINTKFEYAGTSLTENLEETIRNSVKNEIETEQNVDTPSQQLLKDISEAEVQQKLTEELTAVENPQKSVDATGLANATTVVESEASQIEIEPPTKPAITESDTKLETVNASAEHAHAIEDKVSNMKSKRVGRNLISEQSKEVNTSDDKENENVGFQSIEEQRSEKNDVENKSLTSSSSSLSSESKGNSDSQQSSEADNSAPIAVATDESESLENSIENVVNDKTVESTVVETHSAASTAEAQNSMTKISVEPLQVTNLLDEPLEPQPISIVLHENLTSTEPITTLEDNQLEIQNEAHVAETTIMPELDKTVHMVIKKQGVDLNEAPNVEVDEIVETTTVWSVADEYSTVAVLSGANSLQATDDNQEKEEVEEEELQSADENNSNNNENEVETTTQPEVETATTVTPEIEVENENDNHMKVAHESTNIVDQAEIQTVDGNFAQPANSSTLEEHTTVFQYETSSVNPATDQLTNQEVYDNDKTEVAESTTELNSDTTAAYEDDEYSNQDIVPATVVGSDATASTKGSRSINTQTHQSVDDAAAAATLFETFPTHVAGQTFNDNLAAESAGDVGKALPARSINEASFMSRSSIIIVVCSSMALLFLMASVVFFVVSFQRQHGTLDIEMQEQRCGKDDLDEDDEDANTCTKLLEIELPKSTVTIMTADETDECL